MGEGGSLVLLNATPYNWRRGQPYHQYQMPGWNFPEHLPAGKAARIYIEFKTGTGQHDDGGECRFFLDGTDYWFEVQARSRPGFTLQIQLGSTMGTQGHGKGSIVGLGFWHDNWVSWILSGRSSPGPGSTGDFISNDGYTSWMQSNLPTIGNRSLRNLCIPGSHDSGMSVRRDGTAGTSDCNILTQYKYVGEQLDLGFRYFDIRPVWSGSIFKCGHYTDKRGANGQDLSQIIEQVNTFTANNKELVVLKISHTMDTNDNYKPLNATQWTALLNQLLGINNRFMPNTIPSDFTTLSLNDFIGGGRASVVIVVDTDSPELPKYLSKGIYPLSKLNPIDEYSDTNNLEVMVKDQLAKLTKYRSNPNTNYFLLSWTLSQSTDDAIFCVLGRAPSIRDLANRATPKLPQNLFDVCTKSKYPNIVSLDAIQNKDAAALSMAINNLNSY